MYARRRDFELAQKALNQMAEMEKALIAAWADAFYRGSVGHFTRTDAKQKAGEKFRREIQTFDFGEMEDYKTSIEESLEALDQ